MIILCVALFPQSFATFKIVFLQTHKGKSLSIFNNFTFQVASSYYITLQSVLGAPAQKYLGESFRLHVFWVAWLEVDLGPLKSSLSSWEQVASAFRAHSLNVLLQEWGQWHVVQQQSCQTRRGRPLNFLGLFLTWPYSLLVAKARFAFEALLLHRGGGLGILVRRDSKVFTF